MDWISGIQQAIDYVEDHITEELDFRDISKQAYSSSFHFQRVFSILCGYTLGDYIRMRRLSLAGQELAQTNSRILDIALKYGYDTQESFSRSFSRFHGVTPSQAKKGANLKSFSRLFVKLAVEGGSILEYRIETVDAFQIICKELKIADQAELTSARITDFWTYCAKDGTISGLCRYIPHDSLFGNCVVGANFHNDTDHTPYAIGVQYDGTPVLEKNFTIKEIPAHTYAVFTCVGKMPEAFQNLYNHIYSEFFLTGQYQHCNGTDFEVYPSADTDDPEYTCEIWVCVNKK